MRRMPQARGHKARYREDAFYELEKVAKQRIEDRQVRLKVRNVYIGSKIFECQYISKSWSPDKVILKDFTIILPVLKKWVLLATTAQARQHS